VDVSRGQRIGRVSSEWFSRPDDFTNQKSFGFPLTDQTTSRIGGERRAVNPASRQKPYRYFTARKAHRCPFQGAAA
jgi:hypothetical protein